MKKLFKYLIGLTKRGAQKQKHRLAILDDSINYFKSTNRALINGKCVYSPVDGISEGCAIGRLIKDKELCKKLDMRGAGVCTTDVWDLLPIEIKELGDKFLQDLQILHDSAIYWNENGLSERGLEYANSIKEQCT